MACAPEQLWTIEDFRAFADGTDRRSEPIGSRIVATARPAEASVVSRLVMATGGIALDLGALYGTLFPSAFDT